MRNTHECAVRHCTTRVRVGRLMCDLHGRALPKPIRRRVMYHYRHGRDNGRHPTPAYLKASLDAIRAAELQGA